MGPREHPRFLYLQLHLLVGIFALTAIFGRLISLSPTGLVAWRTAIAALLATLVFAIVRSRRASPLPPRLSLRLALALIAIGAILGVHWMCFFGAIKLANISICLAGMATISFFTAFTEPLLERRRVRPLEVVLGGLVLAGILLIAGLEREHWLALCIALLGALLAAIFPVLNRRLVNRSGLDPMLMVALEMLGACLTCLIFVAVFDGPAGYRNLFHWNGLDWLWILSLATLCTVFAQSFHLHLLRHLSAYTSNLATNFEPVYGIAAAAIIFHEYRSLHPGFYLGAAAIVLANLLHVAIPWRRARNHRIRIDLPLPP